jgi:hypothetical protein
LAHPVVATISQAASDFRTMSTVQRASHIADSHEIVEVVATKTSTSQPPTPDRGINYLGHGFVHVVPAAQVCMLPPLHLTVHAASSPQVTMQLEDPVQSAVHPPFGQSIEHVLFPPHATVDPVSTFTLQLLPPPHVTVLLIPVETVQLLVPSHLVVQFERQLP